MSDDSRVDDFRRRLRQDPASIAFAQLAEELRRAGSLDESIAVCREGLTRHPGYLSAHVTLGRALLQLGQLEAAHAALDLVHRSAPQNLAALRGLGEIEAQRGEHRAALTYYESALVLAPNDPELERAIGALDQHAIREDAAASSRATQVIAVLEQWLAAIHVTRTQRHA